MLILALGDTHGHINFVNAYVSAMAARGIVVDYVIQLGDFGFYSDPNVSWWPDYAEGKEEFLVPVIVIPGNHEAPAVVSPLVGPMHSKVKNFQCVDPNGELLVLEANGESVLVLAVPGAACVDNPPKDERMPWDPKVYSRVLDTWREIGEPAIELLITHDCPDSVGMTSNPRTAKRFKIKGKPGEPLLTELWEAVRPAFQLNGHHHKWWEAQSASGLKHATLATAQKGFALYDTQSQVLNQYKRSG